MALVIRKVVSRDLVSTFLSELQPWEGQDCSIPLEQISKLADLDMLLIY